MKNYLRFTLLGSLFVMGHVLSFDQSSFDAKQVKKVTLKIELTPGDSVQAVDAYACFAEELSNWLENNKDRLNANEGSTDACIELCKKGFEEIRKQGFDKFHGTLSLQLNS